jgi:hypothetical protein
LDFVVLAAMATSLKHLEKRFDRNVAASKPFYQQIYKLLISLFDITAVGEALLEILLVLDGHEFHEGLRRRGIDWFLSWVSPMHVSH